MASYNMHTVENVVSDLSEGSGYIGQNPYLITY
jgi:hypothetical protein